MSDSKKLFTIIEVCQVTGLSEESLSTFIAKEWISPGFAVTETKTLDDEDLARIQLILELKRDFGVNDESIPLILHLLDQIHYMRNELIYYKSPK